VYGFPNATVAAAAEAAYGGSSSCDLLDVASETDAVIVVVVVVVFILLLATVATLLVPVPVPSKSGGMSIRRASAEPAPVCPSVDVLLLVIPDFVSAASLDQTSHARKTSR
jgi:hypothetical protein